MTYDRYLTAYDRRRADGERGVIYDRHLTVYDLTGGSPLGGRLTVNSAHFYAEQEVYHGRYWESVQAGSRIDRIVRVPFGDDLTATQYVIPEDGHVYRIEQAQHGRDKDELPVTTLSLRRMEGSYDLLRAEDGA